MTARVVVCILLVVVCLPSSLAADIVSEKKQYLSKLTALYRAVGLADGAVLRDVALPAVILDELNNRNNGHLHPENNLHFRGIEIQHFDILSGGFSVILAVQSLRNGVETFNMSGIARFVTFSVEIKFMQKLLHNTLRLPYFTFNNGSNGIDELTKMEKNTNCVRDGDSCKRGTVVVDKWLNQTLQYQRLLAYSVPLNYVQFIGTHNSFNNKADGYGTGDFTLGRILEAISGGKWDFVWAQQWFSITDQLNMGVRYLMLDPVYFLGEMRLCHCGGGSVKWMDDVIKYIEKVLHEKIDFDSHDLGCMPHDRLFSSAIQEIYEWLTHPAHANEFVVVYINDETSDSDWGKISLIQDPVVNITSSILFTPDNKKSMFPNRWPSIRELLSMGKRLMATCTERCSNEYIFQEMMVPGWDHDTVKYFKPFPNCSGYGPGDWYLVGGESQVINPIYDGPKEEGLVVKENFLELLACPLSVVQLDLASPELLSSGVWSWNIGYSFSNVSNTSCPVIDQKGRWVTVPCTTNLHHTCVFNDTFSISTSSNTWANPQCPDNASFGLPRDGYQNRLLLMALKKQKPINPVWINATSVLL